MKRTVSLIAIATAIILSSGCSKMDEFKRLATAKHPTYTAVFADATRSELTEDGDLYHPVWTAGDRIAITDGYTTSYYKTNVTGRDAADFTFASGVDPEYVPTAFFPSTIVKKIPSVQKYVTGKIFIPMIGEIMDNKITFKNLCGMMKLNISAESSVSIRRIEISADQPICGEYYVEDGKAVVDDEEGILTVEFDEGLKVGTTATPVYISLPENTYTGLTFKAFTTGNNKYCEVSLKRGKTIKIERSMVHEGAITLKNFKTVSIPMADLFDIIFSPDGTAFDASSNALDVQTFDAPSMCTVYDARLGRWVAQFNHSGVLTLNSGYYRADYDDNTVNALAEGHTLECLCCMDIETEGNTEYKMFSTMQSGGTGFLVSKSNAETPMQLTFLPHVGGAYVWAGSEVMPVPGRYYHIVGVFDKEHEIASVYINGELVGEYDAIGDFKAATSASRWFCVGGDSSATTAQNGWKGCVAIARAYSSVLTEDQVKSLYYASYTGHDYSNFFAYTGISYTDDETYPAGGEFILSAAGIEEGDYLCFEPVEDENNLIECATVYDYGTLIATLPASITTGQYRIWACRDEQKYLVGKVKMTVE